MPWGPKVAGRKGPDPLSKNENKTGNWWRRKNCCNKVWKNGSAISLFAMQPFEPSNGCLALRKLMANGSNG
jgi:hypothetical protein